MHGCPLQYQRERPSGELASKDSESFHLDQSLMFAVDGVKVRRLMIVVIEPNDDSEKTGTPPSFVLIVARAGPLHLPSYTEEDPIHFPHIAGRGRLAGMVS